jgi:hypothetical protein
VTTAPGDPRTRVAVLALLKSPADPGPLTDEARSLKVRLEAADRPTRAALIARELRRIAEAIERRRWPC